QIIESKDKDGELIEKLRKVQWRQDSLNNLFRRENPKYHRLKIEKEVATVAKLREKVLNRDLEKVMIEFFWGEKTLNIIAINASDFKMYALSLEACDLPEQVRLLREGLRKQQPFADLATAQFKLYQTLLAPILEGETALKNANKIRRLFLIPDGPLRGIPFAALRTSPPNESGKPGEKALLLYKYSTAYQFSSTLLLENIQQDQKLAQNEGNFRSLYAYAPDFKQEMPSTTIFPEQKFPALIATGKALDQLVERYPSRYFKGEQATEASFKALAEQSLVLYLNTHGLLHDSLPLHSGIIFSPDTQEDGILYTRELFSMSLNTRLVILGACNTGYGQAQPGESQMSLSRGFTYAGCPSMLTSLWEQYDGASASITTDFLRFLEDGLGKDIALQRAQIKYLSKSDHFGDQPQYWAQMIIGGSVAPLPLKPARKSWPFLLGISLALCIVGGPLLFFSVLNQKRYK
ncbi:MAG TPA: CHAT domain-containing protein, partial [Bacteroidetes bacterium]|nr:CHAT domain-containing protein [Bacteroidota bacterium]